ncbi:oligosaccharide MFS transporter [Pseudoduganella namucuonensis]|uniref:MFS transporter, OHS family, lactose permease n=1 Tax=Pseudoduganella namucuonensis TaxID=1035707 RepID=A0A1I7H6R1_9BURK|nr:oligosaccharide MFS transporter [Pseudoduganella namucuonensis]SFU56373.1 MFS transporter, OHS family, lactose permease [Pseudoduganella namucuonensis]
MTAKQSHYRFLCTFVFIYFFAQAMSVSLLALWLRTTLKLTGAETGIVFSANFIAAMCSQPVYGFVSDRIGERKHLLWVVGALCALSGLFFVFVYAPLLKANIIVGAAVGGLYLGVTFIAGSYAVESYVDRIGRRHGFEYSRVRMFGSLGFASAALFSGRLYNIAPEINFTLASSAGLLMLALLMFWRTGAADPGASLEKQHKVTLGEALALLRDREFWRFMVFILGVTNLYLLLDQQFPSYFTSMFPDPQTGAAMFGYLNSLQIFIEAGGLFLSPILVKRIGAKNGLLLAGTIMMIRIAGSGLAVGPVSISAMKILHSVELPILAVSVFRYIACHFDNRLASTVYMVGVSFGHSLGLAILSPIAGKSYDLIGFPSTYLALAALGSVFMVLSAWLLSPTPPEITRGGSQAPGNPPLAKAAGTTN